MKKQPFMERVFGVNWRTSLSGYVTLVAVAIVMNPLSLDFLPDEIEKYLKGIAGLIALISGAAVTHNMKDRSVTGGTVASTNEAEKRVDKNVK